MWDVVGNEAEKETKSKGTKSKRVSDEVSVKSEKTERKETRSAKSDKISLKGSVKSAKSDKKGKGKISK